MTPRTRSVSWSSKFLLLGAGALGANTSLLLVILGLALGMYWRALCGLGILAVIGWLLAMYFAPAPADRPDRC